MSTPGDPPAKSSAAPVAASVDWDAVDLRALIAALPFDGFPYPAYSMRTKGLFNALLRHGWSGDRVEISLYAVPENSAQFDPSRQAPLTKATFLRDQGVQVNALGFDLPRMLQEMDLPPETPHRASYLAPRTHVALPYTFDLLQASLDSEVASYLIALATPAARSRAKARL